LKIEVAPNEDHENSGWEYDQFRLVCDVKYSLNGEEPSETTHTFFGVTTDHQMLVRDLLDSVLEEIGAGMDADGFGEMERSDPDNFVIDGIEAVVPIMDRAKEEEG
jgi:hypothetical protein